MAKVGCTEFLERFVLPLVAGGEMHVGKPIDGKHLEELERELPEASVPLVAIDEAREAVLAKVVVRPPACVFDMDELSLAAAIHNLLFLAHPEAEGIAVSQAGRAKVIAAAQRFAARPRSASRTRVMARHGLLHNFFDIGRVDLKVSWWTGSATYQGQAAPVRLSRWPDVRRVVREETAVGFRELFHGADVAAVVVALVRRSPLSQLLFRGEHGPHLHWEDAVFVIRDAELARAVAYNSLSGADPHVTLTSPARFAASFEQMLERSPKSADVRTVAAFLVHLNCLLALDEVGLREQSPLLATVLGASQRPRGLATLLALPAALQRVEPELAGPPGLAHDPQLAERYRVHREQVLESLGDGLIEGLAERLRRHLGANRGTPFVLESAAPQEDGKPAS